MKIGVDGTTLIITVVLFESDNKEGREIISLRKTFEGLKGLQVHVLASSATFVVDKLEGLGVACYVIDGSMVQDERSFFDHIAQVLHFPGYFGHNWGAWHESLSVFSHNRCEYFSHNLC